MVVLKGARMTDLDDAFLKMTFLDESSSCSRKLPPVSLASCAVLRLYRRASLYVNSLRMSATSFSLKRSTARFEHEDLTFFVDLLHPWMVEHLAHVESFGRVAFE